MRASACWSTRSFGKGAKTKFFGLDVKTNPLLPKLVRQFNCEVYPARCVRLPGNRYRLEIEPKMEVPLDVNGNLDLPATAQMLNDKVESLGQGKSGAMALVSRPLEYQEEYVFSSYTEINTPYK